MSIDYNGILNEKKTYKIFQEWLVFWDIGKEDSYLDNEIEEVITQIYAELFDKQVLRNLLYKSKDEIEDIVAFIATSEKTVSEDMLKDYILKFERAWSRFKSRVILEEDALFGTILKRLNSKDDEAVKIENLNIGEVLYDKEGQFKFWLVNGVVFDKDMKPIITNSAS
ncbi:hypothetical protein M902_1818 [Bacteriovorax sp. BAL6_X]|uniref:hypothetical protein n=1 Tax=Bacteriovorax sp. BAL6_X TaxID=1201290 RepID=UPI0003869F09|nr:hypothetical protein [Bacteriovorax sp. BAL6_X]EPZ52051.1 hypothetical protein M902_1818 [Bacteriovorax sp. BAL6_X]